MSKAVFDASAILAVYHSEPGRKRVLQLMNRHESIISAVNLAEVFTKLSGDGLTENEFVESFEGLGISVVDFDNQQALDTAKLRLVTRSLGLSLGDRACLALAVQENASAVTADKSWATLAICVIEIIR